MLAQCSRFHKRAPAGFPRLELVRNCVRLADVYTDSNEFAVAQHLLAAGDAIAAQAAAAQVPATLPHDAPCGSRSCRFIVIFSWATATALGRGYKTFCYVRYRGVAVTAPALQGEK